MEIEFDIDVKDARAARAFRRARLERKATGGYVLGAVQLASSVMFAAAAVAMYFAYLEAGASSAIRLEWCLSALVLGGLLAIAAMLVKRRRLDGLLAGYERQYPIKQRVSVSGRGLDLRNPYEQSHLSWGYIANVESHGDYVALVLKSTDCLLIPKSSLGGDEDVVDFIEIVKEKMRL